MAGRVKISGINRLLVLALVPALIFSATCCSRQLPLSAEVNKNPSISPDYASVTIPPNIAPLNFRIMESGDAYLVKFYNSEGYEFIISTRDGDVRIPAGKWKRLLSSSVSREIMIDIFVERSGKWTKFKTIKNEVAPFPIDRYLAYRLIEPGYIIWNKMGIYQRDLEDFRETPVMVNSLSDGNCMNCHTFCNNSGGTMMFHMRGGHSGTIIYKDRILSRINTKTDRTISPGVYPSWHPSGNYIAFSTNNIAQNFHSLPSKRVEVFDTLSDIMVYDVRNNIEASCRSLSDPQRLETFPAWAPDGRELYFCSAKKIQASSAEQVRYDLFRIAFDPDSFTFGQADTVLSVSSKGKSISFPRISPDGRYLLFCLSDFGNFSIWHPESDLWLLDLKTRQVSKPDINSEKSESFHTWSSSGRWIVFSSRRDDGLYTRPYFSYFDTTGTAHKPFLLPQKDPGFYLSFLKSYNLPELITSRIDLDPLKIRGMMDRTLLNAKFRE